MSGKLWNMALVFIALLCLPNAAQAATPLPALAPLAIEAPIVLLSTSPERDDTIMMRDPFAG